MGGLVEHPEQDDSDPDVQAGTPVRPTVQTARCQSLGAHPVPGDLTEPDGDRRKVGLVPDLRTENLRVQASTWSRAVKPSNNVPHVSDNRAPCCPAPCTSIRVCCSPANSAIARVLIVWSSYGTVPHVAFFGVRVLVAVSLVMVCPFTS